MVMAKNSYRLTGYSPSKTHQSVSKGNDDGKQLLRMSKITVFGVETEWTDAVRVTCAYIISQLSQSHSGCASLAYAIIFGHDSGTGINSQHSVSTFNVDIKQPIASQFHQCRRGELSRLSQGGDQRPPTRESSHPFTKLPVLWGSTVYITCHVTSVAGFHQCETYEWLPGLAVYKYIDPLSA